MHNCCADKAIEGISRRAALRTAALGGGASLIWALGPGVAAAGQADVLLLTCMDYRLMDEIVAYMDGRDLRDKYDHVILAGASLGALTKQRPSWSRTFFEHVDVALKLHHIKKVMIIDHRDCGAYKVFLGEAAVKDRDAETAVHTKMLKALKAKLLAKYDHIEVELGLMGLDGKVETIS